MKLQERVDLFRTRMQSVIVRSGLNHSRFAKTVGIDRSTLSQLLSEESLRLPRADTIASIAEHYQVSIDWLLGLSQEGSLGADIVAEPVELMDFENSIADTFLEWQLQARGYKVRYVPTEIPDLLKTETVAGYKYARYGIGKTDQSVRNNQLQLLQQRHPGSEMEVCQSIQMLRGFARGEGMWADLPLDDRLQQLRHIIKLNKELYPSFRWFLYDNKQTYSAPFTVYGPLKAVLFIGQLYMLISSIDHIQKLTRRFDQLICMAVVQPHEIQSEIEKLISEIT